MKYLVSVIDHRTNSATAAEREAVRAFNEWLQAEGNWVFAAGLAAPESCTVVDHRGDEPIITDGPFLEAKEYFAGFWIMSATDLDVALRLAAAGSKACNRRVEVRPLA